LVFLLNLMQPEPVPMIKALTTHATDASREAIVGLQIAGRGKCPGSVARLAPTAAVLRN
jgi:hypothetical protein